jgi:hypothetical protein
MGSPLPPSFATVVGQLVWASGTAPVPSIAGAQPLAQPGDREATGMCRYPQGIIPREESLLTRAAGGRAGHCRVARVP